MGPGLAKVVASLFKLVLTQMDGNRVSGRRETHLVDGVEASVQTTSSFVV